MRIDDVVQQEFAAGHFHRLGQLVVQTGIIGVPQHSRHRRELLQLENNLGQADISAMKNMFHPCKQLRNLRVEEIVRIRNDAYFHRVLTRHITSRATLHAPRNHAARTTHHASRGSGAASGSSSSAGSSCVSFSLADSEASVIFIAPTNRPVKMPPLKSVLRKNSQV